jgi:hypothetical protein
VADKHPWPVQHVVVDERRLITVPWLLALQQPGTAGAPAAGTGLGPYTRTLLLKDTAVGDDIADHTTVYADGVGVRIVGVLRKIITGDLTVRLWKNTELIIMLTIPAVTVIDEPVENTVFAGAPAPMVFTDGEVLRWDITSSDESTDRHGVASFTIEWAPPAVAAALARRRLRKR